MDSDAGLNDRVRRRRSSDARRAQRVSGPIRGPQPGCLPGSFMSLHMVRPYSVLQKQILIFAVSVLAICGIRPAEPIAFNLPVWEEKAVGDE